MKIEKREKDSQKRANSIINDLVAPKVAQMMLSGLTSEICTLGKERMLINTPNDFPNLTIHANILKRSSNYCFTEVLGVRDALILMGPIFSNTTFCYYGKNHSMYDILNCEAVKTTGKDVLALKKVVGEHLENMGLELRIDYGGVAIVEKH